MVSSGVQGLDAMTKGGLPQGSVTLVAGGAGTGKTLLGLHFAMAGVRSGEPALYVTFQETPEHLKAIAEGFGWDLGTYVEQGLLQILYTSPVEMGVDEHTEAIKDAIDKVGARRVVIDSLMDIEIATPDKVRFKDYVYSLVGDFRSRGITSMLTNEIPELFGPLQLSAHGISFVSDNVILLRYVEIGSTLRRGISVLKMRGHQHDKTVCEFEISGRGLKILPGFGSWVSILSGQPQPFRAGSATPMRSLSDLESQVLESLARHGPTDAAELSRTLVAHPDMLDEVLENLQRLGFIGVEARADGENLYRWKGRGR
jgi:circadian clock protein KaiC